MAELYGGRAATAAWGEGVVRHTTLMSVEPGSVSPMIFLTLFSNYSSTHHTGHSDLMRNKVCMQEESTITPPVTKCSISSSCDLAGCRDPVAASMATSLISL
ncbi:hypothetical protein B296_00035475 [Ensete ventricosum]|uniref:Uncharacterized protein n=1 Tax=Ensete ventricosum TaxID=4639 RepID=A0A426YN18_ENSVE|nr:hypothetical protein B296_00035475 [Ensete ventricosum]